MIKTTVTPTASKILYANAFAKALALVILLSFMTDNVFAVTNWYMKTAAAGGTSMVNDLNNWTLNSDGTASGTLTTFAPTLGNDGIFHIQNIDNPTLDAALTFGGGSGIVQVILGDGVTPINFTIPAGFALTNTGSQIDMAANATLTISNTTIPVLGSFATSSTVVYNSMSAQTVTPATYANLSVGGSGVKTTSGVSVNGTFTIEGDASMFISAAIAYGVGAGLKYNNTVARLVNDIEWPTPFNNTGGILIAGTGTIVINNAKTLAVNVPLTINSGATLGTSANNYGLTLGGNFTNNGTLSSGTSTITFNAGAAQAISGLNPAAGIVVINKTAGTATMQTSMSWPALTTTLGTLNLGTSLTHTLTGTWTRTGGAVDAGNNTWRFLGSTSGAGTTFTPGTSALEFISATVPQTVPAMTYYNLTLSGNTTKTLANTCTITNTMLLDAGVGTVAGTAANFSGATANLKYNAGGSRGAGSEWMTSFANGTAGVTIMTGTVTLTQNKAMGVGTPLTINSGATLNTANFAITFGGDFVNNGTFVAGSSAITISNNVAQSIAGFTTTGAVSVNKNGNTATLQGNMNAGSLTINESSTGTLDLGAGLTHTITGNWTWTQGTMNGGSSTLKIGGDVATNVPTFNANTSTVEWNGALTQTIASLSYYGLTVGGTGIKVLAGNTSANTLTLNDNILYTSTFSLKLPGAAASVIGAGPTAYVNGNLVKTNNGSSAINFEVGDASGYAPISFTPDAAITAGSLTVSVTGSAHPNAGTSGLENVLAHYWTVTNGSIVGPTNLIPAATYDLTNIPGGDNSAYQFQRYAAGWLGATVAATNTQAPYTSVANAGIPMASITGSYILGNVAVAGTDWYMKTAAAGGTANVDDMNNWTQDATGATAMGTLTTFAPLSGTKYIFHIQNTATPTLSADLTVGGGGGTVRIIVGDGTTPVNFVIPATFALTNTGAQMDVSANGTLTITNTSVPFLGSIAMGSSIIYNAAGAQTVTPATYGKLTVGGTGLKTTSGVTVNETFSIEGDASMSISAAIAYGVGAGLKYNNTVARTVNDLEWPTPFNNTGGILIAGTGTVTLNNAKILVVNASLTINSGATLSTSASNFALTLGGNFTNNGTLSSGTSTITFNAGAAQAISGLNPAAGTVVINKTAGTTATMQTSMSWPALTTTLGTLNLGAALTHTLTSTWTRTGGVVEGSTCTWRFQGTTSGSGTTFTASTSNVEFIGTTVTQIIPGVTYYNLTFSGATTKTISNSCVVTNTLTVESGTGTINNAEVVYSGAGANLRYNGGTRTSGTEWTNSFSANTAGITIPGGTTITLNGSKSLGTNSPLNISSGGVLNTGNNTVTFSGNFVNSGTFNAGSSQINISNNAVQSISGFTTTGLVVANKNGNTATLQGNMNAGALQINTSSTGTLDLGVGLTHTITGNWTRSQGILNGGSSILKIGGDVVGSTGTFNANTGTVEWNGALAQTIPNLTYYGLAVSGSGLKTLSGNTSITTLSFNNNLLYTGAFALTMPGATANVTGAGATGYVNGNLVKTNNGSSAINFEVGDASGYAPINFTPNATITAGSITVTVTGASHPAAGSSGLSSIGSHYWTVTNGSIAGPSLLVPQAFYNLVDIPGGNNAAYAFQKYSLTAWAGASYDATNTQSPYSSTFNTGLAPASLTGDYIVGNPPVAGIDWYMKTAVAGGTANVDDLNNWTQDPAGATSVGSLTTFAPLSGTSYIFHVQNIAAPTLSANLTIGGGGGAVLMTIGDGVNPVNFTIPAAFAFTNTGAQVDVSANATLTITNASVPLLGSVSSSSTVVYNSAGAQTVTPGTYGNLTVGGTGVKTTASISVLGTFTIEGDASMSISAAVAYGIGAGLRYNNSVARTVNDIEWPTPFNNTGGIVIAGTGTVTLNNAKILAVNVPLTINSGATLSTSASNFALTLGGNFTNNGTLSSGTSTITFNAGAAQAISGLNPAAGTVVINKTAGTTATMQTSMSWPALTTTLGTLNLGAALTHTLTSTWTRTGGVVEGSTCTWRFQGTTSGSGTTFTANTSNVEFISTTVNQTIPGITYYNLTFSGATTKSISGSCVVTNTLTVESGTGTINNNEVGYSGASANLRYNGGTRSSGTEWTNSFASSTAGITITSGTTITLSTAKALGTGSPLIINSGGVLNTGNNTVTFSGNFVNNGTFNAGSSPINISNNATQTIAGFTTTGLVTANKNGNTATLQGNMNAGGLTINTSSTGTLDLGSGLVHTITGNWNRTAGILNGGSSILKIAGDVVGSSGTFNANTGTVEWNGLLAQTVPNLTYYCLAVSGSGLKTLSGNTSVTTLSFNNNVLYTGAFTLTMPGTSANVTGAGANGFVNGKLMKSGSGSSAVNFEVGDASGYAPIRFTPDAAVTSGSITVSVTSSAHANAGTSGLTSLITHFWTVANSGIAGPATLLPQVTYNLGDIPGGDNDGYVFQKYASSAWLPVYLSTINTQSPYTSSTAAGLPIASYAGDYVFGVPPIGGVDWYLKTAAAGGNNNIDDMTNWTTDPSGATSIGVLTTFVPGSGEIYNFHIQNIANPTLSAPLTIGGGGGFAIMNVGNGSPVNLTIPQGAAITNASAPLNISANATLTLGDPVLPTFGTVSAASTIDFTGSAALTAPAMAYGNLTYSGSGSLSLSPGTTSVIGNYVQTGSGTVAMANTAASYTMNIGGNFSQSAGTFNAVSASSGVGTINLTGNMNITGGNFAMNSVSGATSTLNVTGTMGITSNSALAFTMNSGATSTSTVTVTGDVTVNSDAARAIMFQGAVGTTGTAVFNANGNVSLTGSGTTLLDWGLGTITNNAWNIKGNLVTAGTAPMIQSSTTSTAKGFVFNGAGTSGAPQTITSNSTGTTGLRTSYTVNSGTYVRLQANLALGTDATVKSSMNVLNGGTMDASTFVVSGGATGAGVQLASGGTLVTAHTGGINGSITAAGSTFSTGASYRFNGGSAQVTGTSLPAALVPPSTLTINNSNGVTLSQSTATTGTLTLTSGILTTGAFTMTTPGAANCLQGGGSATYVNGTLQKTNNGSAAIDFEVGDASGYVPVRLTPNTTMTGGTLGVKANAGSHPNIPSSGFAGASATHYWTITNSSVTGATSFTPRFTYNLADIPGGVNSTYITQKYSAAAWLGSGVASTNTQAPYTTATTAGVAVGSLAGDYIVGNAQIDWYMKTAAAGGNTNVNTLSNWTTDPTGATSVGTLSTFAPTSGTNYNFYIRNIANPTLSSALTIGGGGGTTTLTVGDGTFINFTIPSGFALTNASAPLNLLANGMLTITNTSIPTFGTIDGNATVVYNSMSAQTVRNISYGTLVLGGSGVKTTTGVTVNNRLSMEGDASMSLSAAITYGAAAELKYNTALPVTATDNEWPSTFTGTGGVAISGTGTITMNGAKTTGLNVPLTIDNSASLNTSASNFALSLGGDFTNNGTFTANASGITLANTGTQSIAGFTTAGALTVTKTGGVATLLGNVNAGSLATNGFGGTLNLGAGRTHTISGGWSKGAGTLNGGSSTLRIGGNVAVNIGTFNAGTGTVEWTSSGAQTIAGVAYNNLAISGGGTKTLENNASASALTFTSGLLNTASFSLTLPGNGAVTGAAAGNYVMGTLVKTNNGTSAIDFEVGDATGYAPMRLTPASAITSGSIGVKVTAGAHPNAGTSMLTIGQIAAHYWTVTNNSVAGPTSITPKVTYNLADIPGGSNASYVTQKYASAAWLGAPLASINTQSPYTSATTSGIALASFAGDYIFGVYAPDVSNFTATSATDACALSASTVTINSSTLLNGASYTANYTLTGVNTGTYTSASFTYGAGSGDFLVAGANLANAGATTVTVNYITDASSAVNSSAIASNNSDGLTVNQLPTVNVGGAMSAIAQGGTTTALGGSFGGSATAAVWSASPSGGSFTNNGGTTPGTATYTSSLSSGPAVTLTLTTSGGLCGSAADSKLLAVNVAAGPNVTNFTATSATSPCQGGNATVTINSTSLVNGGSYTANYTLTGANAGTYNSPAFTYGGGTGDFSIIAANLASAGATTVTVNHIADANTLVNSSAIAANNTSAFAVNAVPDVSVFAVNAPALSCLAGSASVGISSSSLASDSYTFAYTLSGANTGSYSSSDIAFVGSSGTLQIPAVELPNIGSTTVTITNVTNAGSACASIVSAGNSGAFPVVSAPVIASVSPMVANPAATVTITGSNFNSTPGNNIVYFGATKANVVSGNASSLTVRVPTGATYMPVSILNTNACALTGYSQYSFLPTYDNSAYVPGAVIFDPKVDLATGSTPYKIAIGDLDGDGKADLAVTNRLSNTVSIYRNNSSSGVLQSSSFNGRVDIATGINPMGVCIGDVDGDGKQEMVIASVGSYYVSVYRNTAVSGVIDGGSFAAKVDYPVNYNPLSVALGDVTQDGRPDVVVANQLSSNVSVLRNTCSVGAISFDAKIDFATASSPSHVAIGDIDNDGKPDLVTANTATASSNVSVLRNTTSTGDVSFAAKVDFAVGANPQNVTIGDLDNDGLPDLAVANFGSNTISVLKNTTSGAIAFAGKVDFVTGNAPYSINISDMDGDSKPDLIVSNQNGNSVSVFRNTAVSGSFTTSSLAPKVSVIIGLNPTGAVVGDLDGDGKPDVALVNSGDNTMSVIRNSNVIIPGLTSISPRKGNVGASVTITGSNFNATAANNVVYFGATKAVVNSGNSTSLTVTVPLSAVYAPVSVNNTGTGYTYYSQYPFLPTYDNAAYIPGSVNLDVKQDFVSGTTPYSVVFGDFDDDGKTDIAVSNADASGATKTVSVFRNTASSGTISAGSLASPVVLTCNTLPVFLRTGDMDGDGKMDIVTVNRNANDLTVFRNTSIGAGSITFSATSTSVNGGIAPEDVAIADFDGDGRPDMAVAVGNTTGRINLVHNTSTSGTVSFETPVSLSYPANNAIRSISTADLDADGKTDIIVNNSTAGTVFIYRNQSSAGTLSSSSFATGFSIATGAGTWGVKTADIDGDGKMDILATVQGSSVMKVIRNNYISGSLSAASFDAAASFTTGSDPSEIGIGDIDGDGKADVIVANKSSNTVSVFRNTATSGNIGVGSFAAKADFATGSGAIGVAVGDVDGDGKADVITANNATNTVSVLRNNPLVAIAGNTAVCQGANTTLSDATANGVWSSANSSVATISPGGVVYGAAGGSAVISYSVPGGVVTTTITVKAQPSAISGNLGVCMGSATILSNAIAGGAWSSGTTAVATVNAAGTVYTVAQGYSVISYTTECGSAIATATISANPDILSGWATPVAATTCAGLSSVITLASSGLVNGTGYTITYDVSGANTVTGNTASTTMGAGAGTFNTAALASMGSNTVTVTSVRNTSTMCSSNVTANNKAALTVNSLPSSVAPAATANACIGAPLTLTGNVTGGSGLAYAWTGPITAHIANTAAVNTSVSAAASGDAGTYVLTVTANGCAGNMQGTTNAVTVNTAPDVTTGWTAPVAAATCAGSAASVTVNAAGLVNGATYTVTYDLTGANTSTGNTASMLMGTGTGSFNTVALVNAGPTSVTITGVQHTGTTCSSVPAANNSVAIAVNQLPSMVSPSATSPVCPSLTIALTGNVTGGSGLLYAWTGPVTAHITNASALNTNVASAVGADAGNYVLTVTAPGCAGNTQGTTNTVTVNTVPDVTTGWSSPSMATTCAGSGAAVTLNAAGLANGTTYTVTYDLSGANTISGATASMLMGAGTGTFTTAAMANSGATTVTITGIQNLLTGCSSSIAASNTAVGTVNALPASVTPAATAAVCSGLPITLSGNVSGGAGLSYSWAGPVTAHITSASSVNTGISSAVVGDAGIYSLTVTAAGCPGSVQGTTASVTVNAIPEVVTGWSSPVASVVCAANASAVTVNASGLTAGTYAVTYDLSGANAATGNTATLTMSSGTGTFSTTALPNGGSTTVTITNIQNSSTSCSSAVAGANTAVIAVNNLPSSVSPGSNTPICVNQSLALNGNVTGGDGLVYSWAGPVTAHINNANSVNAGITAIAADDAGTYSLTVTATGCGGGVQGTAAVTVKSLPSAITGTLGMCLGATTTLGNLVTGGTWTSSNSSVATINPSTGVVYSASLGTTTITYNTDCGSVTANVAVSAPASVIAGSSTVEVPNTIALSNSVSGGVWSSAIPRIATITAGGVVTAVSSGTAIISYTMGVGCAATKSIDVNVACVGLKVTLSNGGIPGGTWISGNDAIATVAAATGIVSCVNPGNVVMYYMMPSGSFHTTTVTVQPLSPTSGAGQVCAGQALILTNGTSSGGVWSSDNTSIATVSGSGTVTGVSGGTSVIAFTTAQGCVATKTVTIGAAATISGTSTICVGQTTTLSTSISGGNWLSNSSSVATLSGGVVGGVSAGSATVTYVSSNGCFRTATVTVKALSATTGVSSLCFGQSATFTNTTAGGGVWSSSNTAVATITAAGLVQTVGGGNTTISFAANSGCVSSKSVTVAASPAISGTSTLCAGATTTLSAATSGGAWSSSAPSVASVSATGVLSGVSSGSATIYYTLPGGCQSTYTVTVNALSATTGVTSMCQGQSATFVNGTLGGGAWSSSNTAVAGVTGSGVVTGTGSGTAVIAFTTAAGCVSSKTVTIGAAPGITGTATVCTGQTTNLSTTATGGNWVSSNGSIANVSSLGVVTGVNAGSATIYYVVGSGCAGTRAVTVNSLASTGGIATLCQHSTVNWTNTTAGGGVWSSNNTLVATVSAAGAVTGTGAGSTGIVFTSGSGCATSKTVTVNAALPVTGSTTVCVGQSANVSNSTSGGNWATSSGSLANISSAGVVTGVSAGIVGITYIPATGCWSAATLQVRPLSPTTGGTQAMCQSGSMQLANATGAGAWSSSNTSVATVNSSGFTKGVGVGSVIISYTSATGCVATRNISVLACREADTTHSTEIEDAVLVDETTLFPNPNTGMFTLRGHVNIADDDQAVADVVNTLGQVVYSTRVRVSRGYLDEQMTIAGGLPGGSYVLRVHSGSWSKVFHFIVR